VQCVGVYYVQCVCTSYNVHVSTKYNVYGRLSASAHSCERAHARVKAPLIITNGCAVANGSAVMNDPVHQYIARAGSARWLTAWQRTEALSGLDTPAVNVAVNDR
jgi:hypothetical protein